MKGTLANAFVTGFSGRAAVTTLSGFAACVLATTSGCSGAPPVAAPTPTPTVGGDTTPRSGTTGPTGSPTTPTAHRPYPIVLAHGFSGFHNIGPLTYFYGVQDALSKDGHEVYITQVDPYNSSEVRGPQLQTQVEQILLESGAPKVNLICHSQGALDCRYVANKLGSKIGAVVLVGGVNRGDYVADIAAGVLKGPAADAVNALLKLLGDVVLDPDGKPDSDAMASINQMSTPGCEAFNAKYPDDPNVAYFSIAGRTDNSMGDYDCGSETESPFVGKWDTTISPSNPLLVPFAKIISDMAPVPPTNDGLVTVASAKWGTFLGCVPSDHLAEICQIGGQSSGSSFDCVTMYRDLSTWLVARGF